MRQFLFYFFLLLLFASGGFVFSPFARELMYETGMIAEKVSISGTGSMYPSFPKSEGITEEAAGNQVVAQPEMKRYPGGIKIFGKSYYSHKLERGDIVEFENAKTDEITLKKSGSKTGFVKRVVALPRDRVELRDGFVYINGEVQKEPYTAKPQSTYGGDFLSDCSLLEVPGDSVFVLGDNRKVSLDSRFELGFVNLDSINYVMPVNMQDTLRRNWRNPDTGIVAERKAVKPEEFVTLLNDVRKGRKVKELKLDPKLVESSKKRGRVILETDDFSIEATKSGMTLARSILQSGYSNIITAEVFAKGFFEPNELLENLFEFPDTKKLLTSGEYQDFGMSAVVSNVQNCPTMVSVIHLGGYRPPNYKNEDIQSWKGLISNLESVLPSWEGLLNAENVDREKVRRLVGILNTRLNNAKRVYSRISKNQWLTPEEEQVIKSDIDLYKQAEELTKELNGQN